MRRLWFAAVAAGALVLAGCSGGGQSGTNAPEDTGSGGSGGLTTITVGGLPIACDAPIWLGRKLGYFKDVGLKVDMKPVKGGAAAVPSVVSGHWQFAASNVVSVMVARDKGLDLQLVSPDCASNSSAEHDATAVVALESSIKNAKDLEGKRVSSNTLKNIGTLTIKYAVEKAGGDPAKVHFVEVGFPDTLAALKSGQIDAAFMAEPFLTTALESGGHVVVNQFLEVSPKLSIDGYFAKGSLITNKPDLVKKFQSAMKKSLQYAHDHPDAVRDIVGTYTKMSEELRSKIVINHFYPSFDRDGLEELGAAAAKFGLLTHKPDLNELIHE